MSLTTSTVTQTQVVTALASLIGVWVLYVVIGSRYLGADADFWETVRSYLPLLDATAREYGFYTAYPLSDKELAGHIPQDIERVEEILEATSAQRNPMAAHKTTPSGIPEAGSWAYRTLPFTVDDEKQLTPLVALLAALPLKQTHVMLFRNPNGGTDIYAHREYNSLNPLVAALHVAGVGLSIEDGIDDVRRRLHGIIDY